MSPDGRAYELMLETMGRTMVATVRGQASYIQNKQPRKARLGHSVVQFKIRREIQQAHGSTWVAIFSTTAVVKIFADVTETSR